MKGQNSIFLSLKLYCISFQNNMIGAFHPANYLAWLKSRNIHQIDRINLNNNAMYACFPVIKELFTIAKIKSLKFSGCWQTYLEKIGELILLLSVSSPGLDEIKLTHTNHITGAKLNFNFPSLTSCDFSNQTALLDPFIIRLVTMNRNITRMNLAHCAKLTDTAFIAVSTNCKEKLLYFNINGCSITDAAILSIAENNLELSYLNISNCGWNVITSAVLEKLTQNCSKLTSFQCGKMYCFSNEVLKHMITYSDVPDKVNSINLFGVNTPSARSM